MAAVTGAKLSETIDDTLGIQRHERVFWSDSMDTLYWIRGQSRRFKPFVSNRVGEIQALSNPERWRHVPTKLNPADALTSGLAVSALCDEEKWWNGPSFLKQDPNEWPENKIETRRDLNAEIRKVYHTKEMTEETVFLSSIGEDRLEPQDTQVGVRLPEFLHGWIASWKTVVCRQPFGGREPYNQMRII